ncbi:ATP-binding protein [Kitasatospora viridis]|uniref:ATP-binding protein n=1 Tax=Kitasatospora viridis TaxID=281105 RepID=UPI0014781DCD|nr:ATP-binding protein [Kitasatospora viridis]
MPASTRSPAHARRVVRDVLSRVKGGQRFAEHGSLLVTELVTNAVLHGARRGTLIYLRVVLTDTLLLEVHDIGAGLPVPRADLPADATCGRGLLLVQRLALRWGCRPRGEGYLGKAVWCECAPAEEA